MFKTKARLKLDAVIQ